MKKFIGTVVMAMAFQSTAFADRTSSMAVQKAQDVAGAISEVTVQALEYADMAAVNNRSNREYNMDEIAKSTGRLFLQFNKKIIRDLKKGERSRDVVRELRQMERSFDDVKYAIGGLRGGALQNEWNDVESSLNRLERTLSRGGGGGGQPTPGGNISASCQGRFGGNFFDKKTSVTCSVHGRGASGYIVEFFNTESNLRGSTSGILQAQKSSQQFKTENVHVGRSAQFQVYITTRNGRRKLVASGTATGNPF